VDGGEFACSQPSRLAASSPYSLLKFETKALFCFTLSLQAAGTSLPEEEAIIQTLVRSSRNYAKSPKSRSAMRKQRRLRCDVNSQGFGTNLPSSGVKVGAEGAGVGATGATTAATAQPGDSGVSSAFLHSWHKSKLHLAHE